MLMSDETAETVLRAESGIQMSDVVVYLGYHVVAMHVCGWSLAKRGRLAGSPPLIARSTAARSSGLATLFQISISS